jgi:hypothetical protein
MSDEEILYHYNRMVEIFGTLPNPEHEPRQFQYFVMLYQKYHIPQ